MKLQLLALLAIVGLSCAPIGAKETSGSLTAPPTTAKKSDVKSEKVVGIGVAVKVEGYAENVAEDKLLVSASHKLRVIQLPKNSPSLKAGIKIGDAITKVDGVDVNGMVFKDVIPKIRGKENTKVKITFERTDSKAPQTVTITRMQLQ